MFGQGLLKFDSQHLLQVLTVATIQIDQDAARVGMTPFKCDEDLNPVTTSLGRRHGGDMNGLTLFRSDGPADQGDGVQGERHASSMSQLCDSTLQMLPGRYLERLSCTR